MERKGSFKFQGRDVTIVGRDLVAGDKAPEFEGLAPDWSAVKVMESTQAKVRIIGSLPSLSTKEPRLLRRSISVVDRGGVITYAAYMSALGEEPDYSAVLEAARLALRLSEREVRQ